ncbi:MAG: response regulator transcription factor [Treponema sp.]|jgi:DNA-binding NarL/FixJ family response regulator|nr:response regulator transcription factor [Treponema sp.]
MKSIVIIEDHPVMRRGLAEFFAATGRWELRGSAGTLEQARVLLKRLDLETLDILLLDIQLGDGWGLDLLPALRERGGKLPLTAVYSAFEDYAHARAALDCGAQGYIPKSRDEGELEAALLRLLQEGVYLDGAIREGGVSFLDALNRLTKREGEVFSLVKNGLSNKAIAEKLSISRRTVENVLSCIYDKTGVPSRRELQNL